MQPVTMEELEIQLAEELPRRELMCGGKGHGGSRQTNNNAALIQLVNFQVNQSG